MLLSAAAGDATVLAAVGRPMAAGVVVAAVAVGVVVVVDVTGRVLFGVAVYLVAVVAVGAYPSCCRCW